jgi:hypothetical protein
MGGMSKETSDGENGARDMQWHAPAVHANTNARARMRRAPGNTHTHTHLLYSLWKHHVRAHTRVLYSQWKHHVRAHVARTPAHAQLCTQRIT